MYDAPPYQPGRPTFPSVHFRLGKGWRLGGETADGGFLFDTTVGTAIELGGSSWGLWPELGYRYSGGSTPGHFVQAGIGPWLNFSDYYVARYSPAFVMGSQGSFALGFRHGLSISLLEFLGIEVSHAYVGGDARHQEMGVQVVTDVQFGIGRIAQTAKGRPLLIGREAVVARLARRSGWEV